MSLKFKNNGVTSDKLTEVIFKDGNTTTNLTEIIMDGNYVWCKPFTYTIGTLPAGCTSLKCYRYSSNEPDATTGEIQNGDKVYYGDKIYFQATFHVAYNGSYSYSSSSDLYTVTGNVVGVTVANVSTSVKSFILTITKNPNIHAISVSRTSSPYKGASTGVIISNTGTVTIYYGDVLSGTATPDDHYDISSSTYTNSGVTSDDSWAPTATIQSFTITWKWLSDYSTWSTATETYNYGETPSRSSPSTVTSGNSRKVFDNWDSLAVVTANRTIQAEYHDEYNVTISSIRCTANKSDGWYESGTIIAWTANENCAFDSSGTSTYSVNITSGGNKSGNANYIYVTITNRNSTSSQSTGWVEYGSPCVFTANTGWAYNSYGTVTTYTITSMTTPGGTYKYENQMWFYVTISAGNHCSVTGTSGWKSGEFLCAWTAFNGWSFYSTGSGNYIRITIDQPGSYSYSADYPMKYTLNISVLNEGYGKSYTVSRTSSPNQGAPIGTLNNGDDIYYGDVITASATAKDDGPITWRSLPTVYAPQVFTSGYTSFSCKNSDSSTVSVNMEYCVARSFNWSAFATNVAPGSSGYLSGLSYATTYWIRSYWTGTQYGDYNHYYVDSITGTGTVGSNGMTITIIFNMSLETTSRQQSTYSGHVEVTTQSPLPQLTAPQAEFVDYCHINVFNPNGVTCTVAAVGVYSENSTGSYDYEGDNSATIAPRTRITLNVYPRYDYHVECDVELSASGYQNSDSVNCVWN